MTLTHFADEPNSRQLTIKHKLHIFSKIALSHRYRKIFCWTVWKQKEIHMSILLTNANQGLKKRRC